MQNQNSRQSPDDQLLASLNAGKEPWAQITRCEEMNYGSACITRYRLGNGLQILFWPDRAAPVFAYQSWFGVGSSQDKPGTTGIAHLFEHLMFKATENSPEGHFDQVMEEHGADTNAATWVDWTYYRAKLPAGNVDLIAQFESDRMANLILDEDQLESEREVVKNERLERVDNDPDGTLYEELYALAFDKHPYGTPTIGWMRDIEAISLEDCHRFYRTYYAPNNATVSVVGDVDLKELLETIQARYGHLSPQPIPEFLPPTEPVQSEEKRKTLALQVATSRLVYAWHAPAPDTEEHAALNILNEILTIGESSVLYRELVSSQEIATETWGWVSGWKDPGLYEIGMNLQPGGDVTQAEAALEAILERVQREGVSAREVEKAQNGLESMFLRGIADTGSRARGIGNAHVTHGDYKQFFLEPERLRRVTPEQVQSVARKVLTKTGRTVVIVNPKRTEDIRE